MEDELKPKIKQVSRDLGSHPSLNSVNYHSLETCNA